MARSMANKEKLFGKHAHKSLPVKKGKPAGGGRGGKKHANKGKLFGKHAHKNLPLSPTTWTDIEKALFLIFLFYGAYERNLGGSPMVCLLMPASVCTLCTNGTSQGKLPLSASMTDT